MLYYRELDQVFDYTDFYHFGGEHKRYVRRGRHVPTDKDLDNKILIRHYSTRKTLNTIQTPPMDLAFNHKRQAVIHYRRIYSEG